MTAVQLEAWACLRMFIAAEGISSHWKRSRPWFRFFKSRQEARVFTKYNSLQKNPEWLQLHQQIGPSQHTNRHEGGGRRQLIVVGWFLWYSLLCSFFTRASVCLTNPVHCTFVCYLSPHGDNDCVVLWFLILSFKQVLQHHSKKILIRCICSYSPLRSC